MDVFRRLKAYYWPYRRIGVLSIVCGVLMTAVGLVRPLFLQWIIDRVLIERRYNELAWLALAVVAVALLRGVFQYGRAYLGHVFGANSVYLLRNRLYQKLQGFSFSYYDKAKTGDLMSRLAGDVEIFRQFLAFGFAHLVDFILLITFTLALMLYLDWSLTVTVLLMMPVLAFLACALHFRVHPAFTALREALSDLSTAVQENITGVRTVKSFAGAAADRSLSRRVRAYIQRHMAATSIWSRFFPSMELLGNIGVLLLLWIGGRRVISGSLTIGELTAFFSYIWYLVTPLSQLGYHINNLSQSIASGQGSSRSSTRLAASGTAGTPPTSGGSKGRVTFDHVFFSYDGKNRPWRTFASTCRPGASWASWAPRARGRAR